MMRMDTGTLGDLSGRHHFTKSASNFARLQSMTSSYLRTMRPSAGCPFCAFPSCTPCRCNPPIATPRAPIDYASNSSRDNATTPPADYQKPQSYRTLLILLGGCFVHAGQSQSPTGSSLIFTHSQ